MFSSSGMGGVAPISWAELDAFSRCGALDLSAWECQRLMEMSRSYCKWQGKGSKQGDIADDVPYIDETRKATGYLVRQREASKESAEKAKTGRVE